MFREVIIIFPFNATSKVINFLKVVSLKEVDVVIEGSFIILGQLKPSSFAIDLLLHAMGPSVKGFVRLQIVGISGVR